LRNEDSNNGSENNSEKLGWLQVNLVLTIKHMAIIGLLTYL